MKLPNYPQQLLILLEHLLIPPVSRENVGGESGGMVDTFGKMNIFEKMNKEVKVQSYS